MKIPFGHSDFKLDVSGIAGFFGGEESLAAMASVHLVRRRRWFGWYNSPGSLHVAKTYATLAQSRTFDRHSRALNVDPSSIMELDGKYGPRYLGVYSGTRLPQTGHMAYLLTDYCDKLDSNSSELGSPVMVVKFPGHPTIEPNSDLPSDHFSEFDPFVVLLIIVNVVTAVLCGLTGDWYSFAMIVLGIVCNGVSCLVLGSGSLQVQFATASKHSLVPDDGLLIPSIPGQPLIILQGSESVVSCLVRGKFNLYYKGQDRHQIHKLRYISAALTIQFLAQLFLIPQGKLFGQIMFLASLGISWCFHSYMASGDRDQLHIKIVLKILDQPTFSEKIYLPKWTAVAAFVAFSFKPHSAKGILDELIPNNTPVWTIWKGRVVEAVATGADPKEANKAWEELEAQLDAASQQLLLGLLYQASIGYDAARRIK